MGKELGDCEVMDFLRPHMVCTECKTRLPEPAGTVTDEWLFFKWSGECPKCDHGHFIGLWARTDDDSQD